MIAFAELVTNKAKKATPASKKASAPEIVLSAELSADLKALIEAKEAKKLAEANIAKAESSLIQHGIAIQDRDGLAGAYVGTYELVGDDQRVKFISTDKFSVSQDDEVHEELAAVLGDKYEEVIEKTVTVTLRSKVFEDENLQKLVVKLLGKHFDQLFETTVKSSVKSGFKEKIYQIAGDEEKLADIRDLLTQAKPSIK